VKLLLELSAEDSLATVESFGTQVLAEDVLPLTTRDFAAVVDSVTTDDVNQVCFRLFAADLLNFIKIAIIRFYTLMFWWFHVGLTRT